MTNRTRIFRNLAIIALIVLVVAGCSQTEGEKKAAQGWTPASVGMTHQQFAQKMAAALAAAAAARGTTNAPAHVGKPLAPVGQTAPTTPSAPSAGQQ